MLLNIGQWITIREDIGKINGNKRIGIHAMLVLLALNGIELKYTQKELYETILQVADGSLTYEELLKWVLEHQN